MPNAVEAFISGLSPKEKKMLYITVGLIALTLFDRLILGPVQKESVQVEEKIASDMRQIRKNNLIIQYKDKIGKEEKDYSIFYTKKGLTSEKMISAFLSEVEDYAKEAKIILTNINPVTTEDKTGYAQFSLTIECSGNMKNIISFIYSIDSSKRPLRVLSYNIVPKDRENYEVKCVITIIKAIIYEDTTVVVSKTDAKKGAKSDKPAPPAPPSQ